MSDRIVQLPLAVPPPGTPEVHPAIRAAADEYMKWVEKAHEASRHLSDLELSRTAAEAEDAQATANALRAGKKDMGPRKLRKLLEDIAEATRLQRANDLAAADARNELEQAVARHGDKQLAALTEALGNQRAAVRAAVEAIRMAHERLTVLLALQTWTMSVRAGTKAAWNPGTFAHHISNLSGRNGEPLFITSVLQGLHELVADPEPRAAIESNSAASGRAIDEAADVLTAAAAKRGVPVGTLTSEPHGVLRDIAADRPGRAA